MNRWRRAGTIEHHYGRIVLIEKARLEALARG
jgi:hypothetical protein